MIEDKLRNYKMSNRITVEPTKFVDVRSGQETFGYRIFDDYGCCYDNTLESIPDDDLELLKIVCENETDGVLAMIDFVTENENGIEIGGVFYDHEEIKHIL